MKMSEKYMNRCLDLAKQGIGSTAPNPSVGAVLVYQDKIIGEGFTSPYGGAHAEVNCINAVQEKDQHLIAKATLFVSLEPCAHHGKTPPCSQLIIQKKIPKVVIGCTDTFKAVNGKGIQQLKDAGIEVVLGVLEAASLDMNKRFFTYHNKKRPYIILKWAATKDGFIDVERSSTKEKIDNWITSPESKKLVHQWRAEEQAIMVGTNTALNDNPELTVREVNGINPTRIVLDLNLRLPESLKVFDQSIPTLVFNYQKKSTKTNLEHIQITKQKELLPQVLKELYHRQLQSVIIEGGAKLLSSFIDENCWDEARIFIGEKEFKKGLKAPQLKNKITHSLNIGTDLLNIYRND